VSEFEKKSALERMRERRGERAAVADERAASGERKRLVVVDDEAPNLDALVRVLNSHYEVMTYTDGPSALAGMERDGCPDLIITDQRMAPMAGVELLKKVTRRYPQAVSIILSGYADRSDLVGAINEAQVFAYVTKPWDATALLSTIDRALKVSAVKKEQVSMSSELEKLGQEMKDLRTSLPARSADGPRLSADEVTARLDRLTETLSK